MHFAIIKGWNHKNDNHRDPQQIESLRVVITALIEKGASVHLKFKGYTPLHLAVMHRNLDLITLLLTHDARPDETDSVGRTPTELLDMPYKDVVDFLVKSASPKTVFAEEEWHHNRAAVQSLLDSSLRNSPSTPVVGAGTMNFQT